MENNFFDDYDISILPIDLYVKRKYGRTLSPFDVEDISDDEQESMEVDE